ncbi:MAG: TetR/AcrR family transcriptional regulator [Chloroflexi bacterium]|nr:TetR/AcrR family transcriptional regulator [Chloroflexota bacterium]
MAVAERTQSEAQRRKQILDAARTVFEDKGYESATISDIVRKAGIAQGTFYLYFESKKDVVVELAQKPMADMAVRVQAILDGTESLEDILRKFVPLGFVVGKENPDLCRLMHMSSENTGVIRDMEAHSEVSALIVQMFQRFMGSGEMVPMNPAVAADMFRIIMTGAMQMAFATDPQPAPLEEIEASTLKVVLGAFVSRPA